MPTANTRLRKWMANIRSIRPHLTEDMVQQLGLLGFEWGTKIINRKWLKRFKDLKDHLQTNGGKIVPSRMAAPLLAFVQKQRAERRAGKLGLRKIERLDSIGFPWQVTVATDSGPLLLRDGQREALSPSISDAHTPQSQDWEALFITVVTSA